MGSCPDTDIDPGLLGYMQVLRAEERMKIGRRQMIFSRAILLFFSLPKKKGGNVLFIPLIYNIFVICTCLLLFPCFSLFTLIHNFRS